MDADYSPRLVAKLPPRPAGFPATYYPFPEPGPASIPPITSPPCWEAGALARRELQPLSQPRRRTIC